MLQVHAGIVKLCNYFGIISFLLRLDIRQVRSSTSSPSSLICFIAGSVYFRTRYIRPRTPVCNGMRTTNLHHYLDHLLFTILPLNPDNTVTNSNKNKTTLLLLRISTRNQKHQSLIIVKRIILQLQYMMTTWTVKTLF